MKINKIAVIGSGTMGNGIAHTFGLNGYFVSLVDLNIEILNEALSTISKNLDRQIEKKTITEDNKTECLENIVLVVGIENINVDTDLIIEAIVENKSAKMELFKNLNLRIKSEAIFASNTSSISITEIASTSRPEKFIGMHFMNPVPMMRLVELIRGYDTSDNTFEIIKLLIFKIDKEPVKVQDYPGFISNRILMPMVNEAIFSLSEGVASVEDIDSVMKLGMAHPMGPLQLADFIGLDVCLAIMNVLYDGFQDSKYRPCPLLKKMVAANKLGRKSKEGFYKYD